MVVSPSVTAKGTYRWLDGHDPFTVPPTPLPAEVLATLTAPPPRAVPSSTEPVAWMPRELRTARRRAKRFVGQAVERAADGIDGSRHDSGVWLACQLRDLRLSYEAGLPYMLAYQHELEVRHV